MLESKGCDGIFKFSGHLVEGQSIVLKYYGQSDDLWTNNVVEKF